MANGLTEEILTVLTRFSQLPVMGPLNGIINKSMLREIYGKPPGNHSVHQAMLKLEHYFCTRTAGEFKQALELAIETNPYISTNGEMAPHLAFAGETNFAMALFKSFRELNPHIPGRHYYAPFMVHAYRAEHDKGSKWAGPQKNGSAG